MELLSAKEQQTAAAGGERREARRHQGPGSRFSSSSIFSSFQRIAASLPAWLRPVERSKKRKVGELEASRHWQSHATGRFLKVCLGLEASIDRRIERLLTTKSGNARARIPASSAARGSGFGSSFWISGVERGDGDGYGLRLVRIWILADMVGSLFGVVTRGGRYGG